MDNYVTDCSITGAFLSGSRPDSQAIVASKSTDVTFKAGTAVNVKKGLLVEYGQPSFLDESPDENMFTFHLRANYFNAGLRDGQILFTTADVLDPQVTHFALLVREDPSDNQLKVVLRFSHIPDNPDDYLDGSDNGWTTDRPYLEVWGPVVAPGTIPHTVRYHRKETYNEATDEYSVEDLFELKVGTTTIVHSESMSSEMNLPYLDFLGSNWNAPRYGTFLAPYAEADSPNAPEGRIELMLMTYQILDDEIVAALHEVEDASKIISSFNQIETIAYPVTEDLSATLTLVRQVTSEGPPQWENAPYLFEGSLNDSLTGYVKLDFPTLPANITPRVRDVSYAEANDFDGLGTNIPWDMSDDIVFTFRAEYFNPDIIPGQAITLGFEVVFEDTDTGNYLHSKTFYIDAPVNITLPIPPPDNSDGGSDQIPMQYWADYDRTTNIVLGNGISAKQIATISNSTSPGIVRGEQRLTSACYLEFEVTTSTGFYTGAVGEEEVAVGIMDSQVRFGMKDFDRGSRIVITSNDLSSPALGVVVCFPSRAIYREGTLVGILPGTGNRVGFAWDSGEILLTDTEGLWFDDNPPSTDVEHMPNSSNVYYYYNQVVPMAALVTTSASAKLLNPSEYNQSKLPYLTHGIPGAYGLGSNLNLIGLVGDANYFDAGQITWEPVGSTPIIETQSAGRIRKKGYRVGPNRYLRTASIGTTFNNMSATTTFDRNNSLPWLFEMEIVPLRDLAYGETMDIACATYESSPEVDDSPWCNISITRFGLSSGYPAQNGNHLFFFNDGNNSVLTHTADGVLTNYNSSNPGIAVPISSIVNKSIVITCALLANKGVVYGVNIDGVQYWSSPIAAQNDANYLPYQYRIGRGNQRFDDNGPEFHLCGFRASVGTMPFSFGQNAPTPYLLQPPEF